MATPGQGAYNAGMGEWPATEIDAWLHKGGLVVAASERAARALSSAFQSSRRREGLTAWPAPKILDWQSFVRIAWDERCSDSRLLLSPAQEQHLWEDIAGSDDHIATLLEGPRYRIAGLAMAAHKLVCSYAPKYLGASARSGWRQDAANFSGWLTTFEQACRTGGLLSPARLPLELISLLEAQTDPVGRPSLLLVGFDRILPLQRRVFDAWGAWREAVAGESAREVRFYAACDRQSELSACALWCSRELAANPQARLLVVTQDLAGHRGEIERTFLKFAGAEKAQASASQLFEFSMGTPLSQVALAKGALLLLRWLAGTLEEHELDWLLTTGQIAANPQESLGLFSYMRSLRQRNLERPRWTLDAFLKPSNDSHRLPAQWLERITQAQHRLAAIAAKQQSLLDWAELVPQLLQSLAWPGFRPLASAEFQALRRWQQCVEASASLGFDGRRIRWSEFLSILTRTLNETLFAPESQDAPIQITGPAESAGLSADAAWFLSANEDAWPAAGPTNPLLPIEVQRETAMPHATPQLDWELARAITHRLLTAAPAIYFSCARQSDGVDSRPSRLVAELAGPPQDLPVELLAPAVATPLAVIYEDHSRIPFPPGKVDGGSGVLTAQTQCPFKAFATVRLAAQSWNPAEEGLTTSKRGQLLHAVLHTVWGGPPHGIRTLKELQGLPDRRGFVAAIVHRTLQSEIRSGLRERMPHRYLELEEQRLTRLVSEWLDYEATRIDFEVVETEVKHTISLAGLTFELRLDRIDRLVDGSLLVVDYKSGYVSPTSWDLPRPEDVQLPLYAGFALDEGQELGGLVFAKVRVGDKEFAGRVGDAKATLLAGLSNTSGLVKCSLGAEQLIDWRAYIEELAKDFLTGRAEVDPRDYPKTCQYCGLQSLCRIQENQDSLDSEDSDDAGSSNSAEGADE